MVSPVTYSMVIYCEHKRCTLAFVNQKVFLMKIHGASVTNSVNFKCEIIYACNKTSVLCVHLPTC